MDFQTHADFEALAARIVLRPEVPAHVALRFDLVRRLVLHSAVDAWLLEAAYDRTLLSFELALRTRYEELEGADGVPPSRQKSLFDLEKWAVDKGLVENGIESLRSVRRLRNDLSAHPSGKTRLGTAGLSLLEGVPRLINELYDDTERRRERKHARDVLEAVVPSQSRVMADLTALGHGVLPVVRWEVLHVENREDPPRYFVATWPLFDPAGSDMGEPVVFVAAGWEADGVAIRFHLEGGREVTIRPATAPEEVAQFESWERHPSDTKPSAGTLHTLMSWRLAGLRRAFRTGQN